ncbi:hypothetical protein DFJ68_2951 [Terracoccus luteus]|uniref:Uncharacterized protein n=1 Tax=Terracoccus luteus TaxID=53356 RepID=A0A495Y4J0_9MICO|nr:hypothetical protein [Terracoccus luteus]RKT79478.1 hypothetical protein DFJ68_2951 [Terracoccus luteus]
METDDDSYGTGAPVHPAFAAHFTDPLYDDPAGEFAPFGSDEGADLLAEWSDRPGDLREDSTLRRLLAEAFTDPSDLDDVLGGLARPTDDDAGDDVDTATMVVGAGFTLLRLTGQVDDEGRELVLAGLRVLTDVYGAHREFEVMRRDLESFA